MIAHLTMPSSESAEAFIVRSRTSAPRPEAHFHRLFAKNTPKTHRESKGDLTKEIIKSRTGLSVNGLNHSILAEERTLIRGEDAGEVVIG